MRIPAWERENFRLNKGNIFPSRKSLISDILAGEGENRETFFYGVGLNQSAVYCFSGTEKARFKRALPGLNQLGVHSSSVAEQASCTAYSCSGLNKLGVDSFLQGLNKQDE